MDWTIFLTILAQVIITLVILAFPVSFFLSIVGVHPRQLQRRTSTTAVVRTGKNQ